MHLLIYAQSCQIEIDTTFEGNSTGLSATCHSVYTSFLPQDMIQDIYTLYWNIIHKSKLHEISARISEPRNYVQNTIK